MTNAESISVNQALIALEDKNKLKVQALEVKYYRKLRDLKNELTWELEDAKQELRAYNIVFNILSEKATNRIEFDEDPHDYFKQMAVF